VLETALSKYEPYGEHLAGLTAYRHSHIALRIHQHCNRRFGRFVRKVPHGLGRGEGDGDTVVTYLERADNATFDVAVEMLDFLVDILPRNTHSEMSLLIRFGGMGWGTWLPGRMRPMSERPVWRWAPLSVFLQHKTLVCARIGIAELPLAWSRVVHVQNSAICGECVTLGVA
jgi:hypothetical protein